MASPEKPHLPVLLPLLRSRLIPWSQDDIRQRFVAACSTMETSSLPEGVSLERRKLRGHRCIVKNQRLYGNTRMVRADWPEDGLTEIEVPKLLCVVDGCADLLISEYQLTCPAGTFVLVPPRLPHPDGSRPHLEGAHRENGFCDLLQILPVHRGIHCWICRSQRAGHEHVPATNYFIRNERAFQLFHFLAEEALAGEDGFESICGHLLATFFQLMHREIQAGRYLLPHSNTVPEPHAATSGNALTELDTYLREHLNEPLTLERVAQQMHLSRAQFARRIRQQTGKTFLEHLTACRLREARVLLTESEWTANTIAEFVGFKSPAYFQRLFHQKVGMTPIAYRRKSRSAARTPKNKIRSINQ
jgi:AraC-like DNA-binding protein